FAFFPRRAAERDQDAALLRAGEEALRETDRVVVRFHPSPQNARGEGERFRAGVMREQPVEETARALERFRPVRLAQVVDARTEWTQVVPHPIGVHAPQRLHTGGFEAYGFEVRMRGVVTLGLQKVTE